MTITSVKNPLKKWMVIFSLLVISLIALRTALPYLVRNYINDKLQSMPDYDGHIGDVDMHLWRGAYQIEDIEIVKTTGKIPVPFFKSPQILFSIQWPALLQGILVGEIIAERPVINFVRGPSKAQTQAGFDQHWLNLLGDLFPLEINSLKINQGIVHYRDFHSEPNVNLMLDQIQAEGKDFKNRKNRAKGILASLAVDGRVFEQSPFSLKMKIDPFTQYPTFDLNLKSEPVSLLKVNDFAKAYANFDFEDGTLAIAAELVAKNGMLKGYVKPLFDNVDIVDLKNDAKNPLQLAWEGLVAGISHLFRNIPKDRLATKIPIEGSFKNPDIAVWPTLVNIFRNAFLKVYQGNIENVIDLNHTDSKVDE